ncbi:MAG: hypothetical protein AB1916_10435 [Thermodesulfobacteriota bacterium]
MVQDATGMWTTPPAPASKAPGSVGPGELPQSRATTRPEAQPWEDTPPGPRTRAKEHATGHILDAVA